MGNRTSKQPRYDPYPYKMPRQQQPTTARSAFEPEPLTRPPPQDRAVLEKASSSAAPSRHIDKQASESAPPIPAHRAMPREDIGEFHSKYTMLSEKASGAHASIAVWKHMETGVPYVVKHVDRADESREDRISLGHEVSILKSLQEGPNIVKLHDFIEEKDGYYLVREFMEGGDLQSSLVEHGTLTERQARQVSKCVLDVLCFMHKRRIVHRDVKPENIELKTKNSFTDVKLANFSFAKMVKGYNGCRTLCGTPGYIAPEILERWPAYDIKCDLFSTGVVLFVMLGGYLPFDDDDPDQVFEKTRNGEYTFHPDYWSHVSGAAKNMVATLLMVNPAKRPSAQLALYHQWMQLPEEALVEKKPAAINHRRLTNAGGDRKMKPKAQAATPTDGTEKLVKSFLRRNASDESAFSVASETVPVHQTGEESATGLPLRHFYRMGDKLGEGGFAVVHRCEHKQTRDNVAVKIMDMTKLTEGGKRAMRDEIEILKLLRGAPHIIRLFDVFEDRNFTYIVMEEMAGGHLLQRIVDKETYTEREARSVCKILFTAVDYCHKMNIAHRDLKPDNLLLTDKNDDTSIKIADFGFAKRVPKPHYLDTLCGTYPYMAPEIIARQGYDEKADMWSIGVVMYILLGGYSPFEGSVEEMRNATLRGDYEFHDEYWVHTSPNAKNLITSCLKVDPDLRITAEGALQSDWMNVEDESLFSNDLSVVQDMMKKNMAIEKLKGAVYTIILANRINSSSSDVVPKRDAVDTQQQELDVIRTQQQERDAIHTQHQVGGNEFQLSIDPSAVASQLTGDSSIGIKTFHELYELGKTLQDDHITAMHEAVHRPSRQIYTVKSVNRRRLHPRDAIALQDEIIALRSVAACPHIVTLLDFFHEPDTSYLVFERMRGGDLIERIIEIEHYTEADARAVCKSVLLGVQCCHEKRIAHRNLKPENILLTSEENNVDVKISDFGYAKKVLFPDSLRTQCGTEGYVAPEILEHKPAYDLSCDMWSMGVILFVVLGGYRPFFSFSSEEVLRKTRYGEYEFDERYWNSISDEAKDLIRRMLTVNPKERVSASEALKSPWIMADDSTLQSDLSVNQEELRNYAAKAKIRKVAQMMIFAKRLENQGKHHYR